MGGVWVNLRSLIFGVHIRMRDLPACMVACLVCVHLDRVVVLCWAMREMASGPSGLSDWAGGLDPRAHASLESQRRGHSIA